MNPWELGKYLLIKKYVKLFNENKNGIVFWRYRLMLFERVPYSRKLVVNTDNLSG